MTHCSACDHPKSKAGVSSPGDGTVRLMKGLCLVLNRSQFRDYGFINIEATLIDEHDVLSHVPLSLGRSTGLAKDNRPTVPRLKKLKDVFLTSASEIYEEMAIVENHAAKPTLSRCPLAA